MGQVAGDGDDRVGRPVQRAPEVAYRRGGEFPDPGLVAADLSAERPVPEHRALEQHLAVLGGIVEVRADLLDDDRPLVVDVLVGQHGPDDQLPDDVHGPDRLTLRDADPVDGRFAIGGGVERAADALDRLADGARRGVGGCALEGDVLHEVGHARLGVRFQARTGQDVGGDGHGACAGHPGGDDTRPGRQLGSFEHAGMVAHRAVPAAEGVLRTAGAGWVDGCQAGRMDVIQACRK